MNPDRKPTGRGETRPQREREWPRGDALDALLARDEVEVPHGLAERTAAGVAAARREVGAGGGRRWRLRRVVPVAALAAAAALALYVALPGGESDTMEHEADAPSDDLLAALPELEAYAFLSDELEPLEEHALFLLEPVDELVLEVLDEE